MSVNKRLIPGAKSQLVPSEHFAMIEYTGNNTGGRSITVGFQPDVVLIKNYSSFPDWVVKFSKDFPGTEYQPWDAAVVANDTDNNRIRSLDSNGFTLGNESEVNGSSAYSYVAYCWKIGGNSSNPDKNLDAGMAQRSYNGNGTYGRYLSHGLGTNDVTFCILRTGPTGGTFNVKAGKHRRQSPIYYNRWGGLDNLSDSHAFWADTSPNTSNFRLGNSPHINESGGNFLFWGMSSIAGFSKFDKYTGTGSVGNSVNLGFQPGLLWIRRADTSTNYHINIHDTIRHSPTNNDTILKLTDNGQESQAGTYRIDMTSTGFTIENSHAWFNASGATYYYWAWVDPYI